jgi:endonuclease YncB( thermonuclease family)
MNYTLEFFDARGLRIARFTEVPVLEVWRRGPDEADEIRGLLAAPLPGLAPGCTAQVRVGHAAPLAAIIHHVAPEWSDAQKLILDDYIALPATTYFEASTATARGNEVVSRTFADTPVADIVRAVVNAAPGPLHYTVAHTAYPEGAEREHAKFLARKTPATELELSDISQGQWVSAPRIDATSAYAKDGDTIAGLVVDGVPWPDLRLMMIDCEETTRNSHAIKRHPDVGEWSNARYAASGYKLRADAAKSALQSLIDAHGIDHIELNPHRDALGEYDDRVDAYGRYIGLVYGGGQCFNAGLVELGHADVYLYEDGRYHVPEMALKDYYAYRAPSVDSIEEVALSVQSLDVRGGALEAIAALAYIAGGYTFEVDEQLRLSFRQQSQPQCVCFFDPARMGLRLGGTLDELANLLLFRGNPETGDAFVTHTRGDSMDAFGVRARVLTHFGFTHKDDADHLCDGLLDDLAWPTPEITVTHYRGHDGLRVGDLVELRGAPVQRLDVPLAEEWGGAYADKLVGRVTALRHRIAGREVETTTHLGPPLRSVRDPLAFLVRSQEPAENHFRFRLDDTTVGLDQPVHLD